MAEREIPKGRLGRIARLASAGARTGASMLLNRKDESVAKSAAKAATALGDMRALGAKLGQMLAYIDGMLPEDQQAIFSEQLKPLLEDTPTSSFESIRAQIQNELGKPLEDLFLEFGETPIASASLGQVHRAKTKDGLEVAVKVQHPGIEEALEMDLKNVKMLEGMASMMGSRKFDSANMIREIQERFREELDYTLEAHRQRTFHTIHEPNPRVLIPRVIDPLSTRRVLTSEFLTGLSYEEACATPDEAARAAWCETLWRFVYGTTLIANQFNADPHPGNYRFRPGGEVVFFDFGCIQTVPVERTYKARKMHLAAARGQDEEFERCAIDLFNLKGGTWEKILLEYLHLAFKPWFDSPFRFSPAYVRQVVEFLQGMKMDVIKLRDDSFVPMEEGVLFVNRLQFGFYSVLAGLDAEFDYGGLEIEYLEPVEHETPDMIKDWYT